MTSQRPFLILGETLRRFLQDRRGKAKAPLMPDQLYCLSCKVGRKPMGMMADCHHQSTKTARLEGLCEVCGSTCNRMISLAKLDHFHAIFDIACKGGPQA